MALAEPVLPRRPRGRCLATATLALLAGVALSGCNTIPLRTAAAPAEACDAALVSGTLVNNRPNGLALAATDGEVTLVLWPVGYTSRGLVGNLELVDERGQVVAREGDDVHVGGGMGGEDRFVACPGTVSVIPPGG